MNESSEMFEMLLEATIGALAGVNTEENRQEVLRKSSQFADKLNGNGKQSVQKLVHPKIKSTMGYQSKKLSHDADIALKVIKQVAGQYNLAPIVAVRRALATAGFSSRGQQDSLINELRRAMRISASGFEGRHGISKEEQDAAIVEGTTRLGFISLR